MKTVTLPSGEKIPALGQGTWFMGEDSGRRKEEIATLRRGVDIGLGLIDTAEMYGDGRSEELVGEAIVGRRNDVFLVSKVYPHNASREGVLAACERSLRRLKTDRIDLYLLHWRGGVPFSETVSGFETLQRAGKIRYWGVSNLDLGDMRELAAVPGGGQVATNQLLYNLTRRGIEFDLLPWCERHRLPVMAYSPIEQARLLRHAGLMHLAAELGQTPSQLSLAWVLRRDGVVAIPKTSNSRHLEDNVRAVETTVTPQIEAELDKLFPPPKRPVPLEML
ncbi:MAG: aldo/keto reductase [Alphaproteobacteria bacterium]|nr:aldo/keto reductase [Alphaproteobacteria bacterium]